MMMENKYIKQWLTDYKSTSNLAAFAKNSLNDGNLISALWHYLEKGDGEHLLPTYSQLFEFYKSGNTELKRFTLQLLPIIIWSYLQKLNSTKICGQIESFLLGLFNLEAIEEDGNSKRETFTIPTLAKPSVYHEPSIQLAIPDNILLHQESEHMVISRAPLPQIDTIRSQNRLTVLTELLRCYNADVAFYHAVTLQNFCSVCSRIALSGIPVTKSVSSSHLSNGHLHGDLKLHLTPGNIRVPVTHEFLSELLNGVYYVMFNGHATAGTQALEAIHCRATYEMYPEVLLVTNAIKHSLDTNPSGRPTDGPVGINISVTPASPVAKKAAITNASFKTNKSKVTIEGIEPTSQDQTDHLHLPKQSDCMHRLAVTNHARINHLGKGSTNGVKVSTEKTVQSVSSTQTHIRQVQSKVDHVMIDGVPKTTVSVVGNNNEMRKQENKHTAETNL